MKFKDLHIVSKIMVFCAGLVCAAALIELAPILKQFFLDEPIVQQFGVQDFAGAISNFTYGLGFLATAVTIELLRKILTAIEKA